MSEELDFYSANGALAGVEVLDVDALRLMYRLELSGEDFYNGLADRIGNDEAAELLRRNGREEAGHAARIAEAIAIRLGIETYEPEGDDLVPLAAELPDRVSPPGSCRSSSRPSSTATSATSAGPTTRPIPPSPGSSARTGGRSRATCLLYTSPSPRDS